jgi:hypothetical protein
VATATFLSEEAECLTSFVLLFDKTRTIALKGQAAAERQRAQPVL